jgi:hypothetical protein
MLQSFLQEREVKNTRRHRHLSKCFRAQICSPVSIISLFKNYPEVDRNDVWQAAGEMYRMNKWDKTHKDWRSLWWWSEAPGDSRMAMDDAERDYLRSKPETLNVWQGSKPFGVSWTDDFAMAAREACQYAG